MIKAFADILEAPGGLLLATDPSGAITTASAWNWSGRNPPAGELDRIRDFWTAIEANGRIVEFDAIRNGWARPEDCVSLPPQWLLEERRAWIGVPLIHGERLFGLILLASPEYRRVARLGGFRPAPHRRPPGREFARRSTRPGGAVERAAVRGIQPPLRLHPARHQESGQPAVAAFAQCRTARRQSGIPRGHGRDLAQFGRQDERPSRPPLAPGADARASRGAAAASDDPRRRHRRQAPRPRGEVARRHDSVGSGRCGRP